MKKSVAITTIIAFHAALIGGMLIQAGCSSEPSNAQPAKAKSTVEEIAPQQKEEDVQPIDQKEIIPPEGSPALRAAPTRPVWNMSGTKTDEIVAPEPQTKPDASVENAPAPVKPAPTPGASTYTVQKGDSLAKIAKKHNVALDALLKQNGMNRATIIQIGQEISIPAPDPNAAVVPSTPVAPKIESAVETSEISVYIVRKGDSLGRLSRKYKTTIKHLMDLNGLKNHNIRIGQKLNVPKRGSVSAAAAAPESKAAKRPALSEGEIEHVVKSGETLGGIAIKYKTSVKALMERNSIKDPRKLRVGQVLAVSSGAKPSEAKQSAPAKQSIETPKTAPEPAIPVIKDAAAQQTVQQVPAATPQTSTAPSQQSSSTTPTTSAPNATPSQSATQSADENLTVVEL